MRLSAQVSGRPSAVTAEQHKAGERAATRAVAGATDWLKQEWRDQVRSRLSARLANTVRGEAYPSGANSWNAAGLVWTNAPHIIGAHEEGSVIRSADGFWLAIPLPAAGKGNRGRRITPALFEQRTGLRLRFVYRPGRTALLVADDARISSRGETRLRRGRRRRDGVLTGAQTVPVFVLVPQVKLPKRLRLMDAADQAGARLAGLLSDGWDD